MNKVKSAPTSHFRIEILKSSDPEDLKLHAQYHYQLNHFINFYRYHQNPLKSLHFYIILNLMVSLTIYIYTLKGCKSRSMSECVPEIVPLIPLGICVIALSAFQVGGVIYMIFLKIIKKIYLIHIGIELIIILFISNGSSFQNHGLINKGIFLAFLLLSLISLAIGEILYRFIKKKPLISSIFIGFLIISTFINFRYLLERGDCGQWDKGLMNTRMDNSNNSCEIPIPKFCFLDFTSDWFDLSIILNKMDCSSMKQKFYKYKEENILAFPKTQYFSHNEQYIENFQTTVLNMIQPIHPHEVNNNTDYEIFLNQTDENDPNIIIKVNRNQSLIDRSLRILEKTKENMLKTNILSIFIDSVSRQHFRRKMPLTYKFIEGFYGNSRSTHESYQFFKYHASGTHTLPNMLRAFYGVDENNNTNPKSLLKIFKKHGYITAKSANLCSPTYFDITAQDKNLKDFQIETFDHENIAMACDPNYRKLEETHSFSQGVSCLHRRCLYGKEVHNYILEYGDQFWRLYKDSPRFLELDFLDGHEHTAEVIKYLDEPLHNFLRYM